MGKFVRVNMYNFYFKKKEVVLSYSTLYYFTHFIYYIASSLYSQIISQLHCTTVLQNNAR